MHQPTDQPADRPAEGPGRGPRTRHTDDEATAGTIGTAPAGTATPAMTAPVRTTIGEAP